MSYTATIAGGPPTTSQALIDGRLGVLRPQSYAARSQKDNVSGRANLSWRFVDDFNLHAVYARGFTSGGINVSGFPVDDLGNPVLSTAVIRPEFNTTYATGLKDRLGGDLLTFAIDGLNTRVEYFEATIVDSRRTVALRGYLSNVRLVTVRGFEANATCFGAGLIQQGRHTSGGARLRRSGPPAGAPRLASLRLAN